jgi:hypothetical protein
MLTRKLRERGLVPRREGRGGPRGGQGWRDGRGRQPRGEGARQPGSPAPRTRSRRDTCDTIVTGVRGCDRGCVRHGRGCDMGVRGG